MTDEEWLACDTPGRMRHAIGSRGFHGLCGVLFDLACIRRVRDLLGTQTLRMLDEVENWDDLGLRALTPASQHLNPAREDARSLWRLTRTDALYEAKNAATRAVLALGSHTLHTSEMVCVAAGRRAGKPYLPEPARAERRVHAALMRCMFGGIFSPVVFSAEWRTATAVLLASQVRGSGDYSALPILADALQDAGCEDERVLGHCRSGESHVRGCWVVNMVMDKS